MNLHENIQRIKEVMGLLVEQTSPFYTKEGVFNQGGPVTPPMGSVEASRVFPNIKNGKYPPKIDPSVVSKAFAGKAQMDRIFSDKIPGASKQVQDQIDYLKKNKLMGNEKFTILDDSQAKIYLFNPGYQLVRTFLVLTGKWSESDKFVVQDFYKQVWNTFKDAVANLKKEGAEGFVKRMEQCYAPSEDRWPEQSTPAGIFRRTAGIKDTLEDEIARQSDIATYGEKYMSFETFDGNEAVTAFHGTKKRPRIDALTTADLSPQSCKRRKMSKGCINFKEPDIFEIEKFIKPHQKSIWLPSDGKSIITIGPGELQIPPDMENPSFKQRVKNSFERLI